MITSRKREAILAAHNAKMKRMRLAIERGEPVNIDASDIAKLYGLDAVREAIAMRQPPWPVVPPYDGEVSK